MFKKILIANRGEIALRVLRTAKEMRIDTVVVYSTADRETLPVHLAGEAVCIGGPKSKESYLNMNHILSAAVSLGCDAIHPGYGFLSERADFAELVEACGLTFIGPKAETIRCLGDKAEARKLMKSVGVPTVPGSEGLLKDAAEAEALAMEIGFPVLLKATAGGGGRGMRVLRSREEVAPLFAEAEQEAELAFGDGSLYLEKLITGAKHLEFQILADNYGKVLYFAERDCSLQRKRQKMIEESPCLKLSAEKRAEMGEAAVKAAKAANYRGAGTVEFLLAPDGQFYFIEVNTRIQVEHPVTEMLYGIDLIREQIMIANGTPLRLEQEELRPSGHVIECRINAEEPLFDFRPAPGEATRVIWPGGSGTRVDSAIYSGAKISPWYDSMMAKIIVRAPNRSMAIRRMRRCLAETLVEGMETNLSFLTVLTYNGSFIRGDYQTSTVDEKKERLLKYSAYLTHQTEMEEDFPAGDPEPKRNPFAAVMRGAESHE